eukprot:gene624-2055_t
MPRKLRILLIAGPHSGVGKTFVTTGLAKALRAKGEHVEVFREGPELQPCCLAQDPLYIASGTCPSSLDSWLLSPGHIQQYLADRCSSECTVALIDSSLGLWDAAAGVEDPQYCAAQVAKTLGASTVLVIDQCASTNSAVALLRGYVGFDPGLEICGVICNKAGQSISRTSLQAAAASAGLDTYILGALPKVDFTPSQAEGFVEMAAAFVNSYTDVDELLRLTASRMQTLPPASTSIPHSPSEPRPRIAVAEDEVFHSSYPENPALLSLAGAEVVYFSPLRDGSLPPNISAIILGAGSLSSHGPVLAANIPMLTAVRVFAQHGGLVYAESAGLSYLASSVQLVDGGVCKMAGVFPFCAAISSSKPRTGYVELVPLQPGYCSLLPSDSAPPLSVGGRSSDRSSDRSSHASTTGGRSSNSLRGWYQGSVEILEAPRQHGQQQQQQPQPPAGQALGQGQLGPSWPRQQQKQQKQKQKQLCHIDVNRSQAADMQQHLLIHEPSECGISTSMQPNPLRQEVSEGCLSNASAAASITSRGESNPGWSHPTHIPIPSQRMLSSSSSSPNLNNSQQLMFEDRQRQVPYSPSFMSLDLAVRQSDAMEHSRSHGVSHRQSMQELDHSKHQGTMHNPNFKYSSDNLCSKTCANGRTHAKLIGLSVPLRLSTSTASLPGGSEAALKAPGPRSESSKSGGGGGEGSTAPSAAVGSTAAAIPPLPPTHPLSPMPRAPPRAPGGTPPGHAGPGASPANSNGTSPSQSQGHGANGSTLSPAATEVSAAPRDSQGMGHGVNGSVLSPAAPGAAAAPRDSRDCHETTRNDSELVSRDGLNHERGSPFQDSPTTTTNDYDSAEASRPLSTDLPVPLSRPISGPLSCPVSWSSDPMDSPHHSSQGSLDLEQRQARAHALAEERLQALKLQQQMRQAGGQAGGIGTRQVGGHAGQHLIHGAGPASGEGLPPLPGDAGARGRRSQSPWGGALPLPSDAGAGGRRSEPGWDGLPPLPSDAGAGGRRSQSGWGGPVQPQQGHDTSGRLSITYRRLNDSNTTLGSDEGEGEEDGETDALWDTLQPYPYRQGGSGGAADRVGAVRKSIQVPSTRNPQHTAPLRGSFQGPAMHASASTGHLARPGPSLGLQGGRQCSIVSFSTGATEALLALGLAQRISGVSDDHSNSLVGEALRDVPVLCKNRVRMLRQQQTEGSENRGGSASQQGGDIAGGVGGLSPRQIGLDCLPGAGGSGGQGSDTEAPSSVEALILKKLHREGLSQWMLHEGGLRTSKANLLVLPSLEEMHSVDRNELIKALQQSILVTASNTSAPGALQQSILVTASNTSAPGWSDHGLQHERPRGNPAAAVLSNLVRRLGLHPAARYGDVAGVPQPAALLVDQLRSRLRRQAAASCTVLLASSPGRTPRLPSSSAPSSSPPTSPPAPRLLILSGVAPFTQAGLWVPDMLSLLLPLTSPPRPSGSSSTAHLFRLEPGDAHRQISWEHIVSMAPDVLVIANDQSEELLSHMAHLAGLPGWWSLPAVVSGRVFLVQEGYLTRPGPPLIEGDELLAKIEGYLTRPGPRLIEGVELLAKILHPDLLPARRIQKASVLKLSLQGGQRCRQCLIPNYFIPWQ